MRCGARTVELRDWRIYLNGERVFMRGINYLPTDVYPARASEERLRADASLVRGAGMNAVRVHVHVAERSFYEACDELGLLVFQDFPLQVDAQREVLEPAVRQAREMARDLRSYPSVGVYLAHDEPFYVVPPEKWNLPNLLRTGVDVLSPRWALWQRRVLGPAVVRSIEDEDASRPVIDAAGHPPDDEPPVLRLVLREVQGPRAGCEDLPWPLAAADGIRGAGAPRPGVAGRDLAFRDGA